MKTVQARLLTNRQTAKATHNAAHRQGPSQLPGLSVTEQFSVIICKTTEGHKQAAMEGGHNKGLPEHLK